MSPNLNRTALAKALIYTPYILHPAPCTLHPAPCTLHPKHKEVCAGTIWRQQTISSGRSRSLHPTPYTLHPTPYTLHPTPYTLHPTPYTLHPTSYTHTLHPTP